MGNEEYLEKKIENAELFLKIWHMDFCNYFKEWFQSGEPFLYIDDNHKLKYLPIRVFCWSIQWEDLYQ